MRSVNPDMLIGAQLDHEVCRIAPAEQQESAGYPVIGRENREALLIHGGASKYRARLQQRLWQLTASPPGMSRAARNQ